VYNVRPMEYYWRSICRHNTDVNNDTHIGTRYILAKHWIWLPDAGFM